MPDDLERTVPEDATRINLEQPDDVDYWCVTLKCSEEQLRKAVETVGVSVEKVRIWLARQRRVFQPDAP